MWWKDGAELSPPSSDGSASLSVLSAALQLQETSFHETAVIFGRRTWSHPFKHVPANLRPTEPTAKCSARVPRGKPAQAGGFAHPETIDLAHGPLFRVVLYLMEEQQHVLCVAVHHIIYDAWSGPLYIRELNILYNAFMSGKASPLPELPVQYADVAVWEREWLRDEVLERHIQYWRQALEGASHILNLPTHFPRPDVQSFDSEIRTLRLSPELSLELKKLSQRLGATELYDPARAYECLAVPLQRAMRHPGRYASFKPQPD